MHSYLSRDGVPPHDFLATCREQLGAYPSVQWLETEVVRLQPRGDDFDVTLVDGTQRSARTVLIATGLVDQLPEVEGFKQFYGRSVHHCPYCDGWEHRDQPLAVLGGDQEAADLALELLLWSRDMVLCTNGPLGLSSDAWHCLERNGIRIIEEPVTRLEGEGEQLSAVRFASGWALPRSALFFPPKQRARSELVRPLGAEVEEDSALECGENTATTVPGIFVAGNASAGLQLVIVAAAEGATAACAINERLLDRDRQTVT